MDNSSYINLNRQSGLLREMSVIANNIANISTTGYRREGVIFSEYVRQIGAQPAGGEIAASLEQNVSMGGAGAHFVDFTNGSLTKTGGNYDFAIDGDGFFLIDTPDGERLARAGRFMTNGDGMLITSDGNNVLDEAGAPIQIPPDVGLFAVAGDGSMSADGNPLGKIGVVMAPPEALLRSGGNLWQVRDGQGFEPIETPRILQGFLEGSNVEPILEIARMIEVQRAYEAGQQLLDIDNDRISKIIRTISQSP